MLPIIRIIVPHVVYHPSSHEPSAPLPGWFGFVLLAVMVFIILYISYRNGEFVEKPVKVQGFGPLPGCNKNTYSITRYWNDGRVEVRKEVWKAEGDQYTLYATEPHDPGYVEVAKRVTNNF